MNRPKVAPRVALRRAAATVFLRTLALMGALAASGAAHACSCVGPDIYLDASFRQEAFLKAPLIVHARVTGLISKHEARIEMIEAFKGSATVLHAWPADSAACGTTFKEDEEALYISYDGRINLCGRLPPRPDLLRKFRAMRR